MPINDDVSKPIKLIEKNIEIFQMDPIYEINRQFAYYVLLDTRMLQRHQLQSANISHSIQERLLVKVG